VQTSTRPDADPDPAHWLHGVQVDSPQVNVVWRADVLAEAFPGQNATDAEAASARQRLVSLVSLCPPGSSEAMSLPLHAVRAWLAGLHSGGGPAPSFSDTTLDVTEDAGTPDKDVPTIKPALHWRGDDSRVVTTIRDIQPGSTLVVPATYGGIRADNWDPTARVPVSDLGTAVQARQRTRPVLRLYPAPAAGPDGDNLDRDTVSGWLDELADQAADPKHPELRLLDQVVDALRNGKTSPEVVRVELAPPPQAGQPPVDMIVVRSRRLVPGLGGRGESSGADSEPATSSFLGAQVLLKDHLSDVERWSRRLGETCGFSDEIVEDLALAGRLHDLGKVDQRFQLILNGGTVVEESEPLAKSDVPAGNYRARRYAQQVARYPTGTRHELASVALVEHDRKLQDQANDWDLVLHLIASHHGYARPFVPVSVDDYPQQLRAEVDGRVLETSSDHGLLRLDSGVPQRFWRCVRRYGWYGLAWLEAVLRLADHRASEERDDGLRD
ncbi:MAG: CRISPR-associated endonuclease Cas3'', partial [Actinobacteria bacterium]|nr:CRISPR-associated endonuclease Cas3'' [Actinomycetota bacterium]